MNIIARKPKDMSDGTEYVVIDRGPGHARQFVSATVNALALASGEWYWGHYYQTIDEAMDHFNSRRESLSASLFRITGRA